MKKNVNKTSMKTMLKKAMVAVLLIIGITFSHGQQVFAEVIPDTYIGTYPGWGAEAYLVESELLDYFKQDSVTVVVTFKDKVKAVKGSSITYLTYKIMMFMTKDNTQVIYTMSNGNSGRFWLSNPPEKNRISANLAKLHRAYLGF